MRRALSAFALVLTALAHGQTYPSRPITVFVGFPAGGSVDLLARAAAEEISVALGQRLVVMNRDGASSTIAMSAMLNAPADGYTLAAGAATPFTHVLHIMKDKPFVPESFEFICQTFRNEFTISVRGESPIKNFAELLDLIRAQPGKLSYGHSGHMTAPHLGMVDMLRQFSGQALDVPFKGEAAMLPVFLGGNIDFATPSVTGVSGQRDRVRALAVFADQRLAALPATPSTSEAGLRLGTHAGLNGLFAAKGTPREVLRTLEAACERAVKSERFAQATARYATAPTYLNSADFTRLVLNDHRQKGELIRSLDPK
jgi:tripartite-type tricarboxylate transporter receptor subunit TctC